VLTPVVGEFVPTPLADAADTPFQGGGFGLDGGCERRSFEALAVARNRRRGGDADVPGFVGEVAPAVAALVAVVGGVVFRRAGVGAEIDDVLAQAGEVVRREGALPGAAAVGGVEGVDEERAFLVHPRVAIPERL